MQGLECKGAGGLSVDSWVSTDWVSHEIVTANSDLRAQQHARTCAVMVSRPELVPMSYCTYVQRL